MSEEPELPYTPPNRERGRFSLEPQKGGVVKIQYALSEERIKWAKLAGASNADNAESFELLRLDADKDILTITPRKTLPHRHNFLKPRYEKIRTIALEGFNFWTPEHSDAVYDMLEELPMGMIKNPEYGLGIRKDYRFIIQEIEKIASVKNLVISRRRHTTLYGDTYVLSFKDFDELRRAINRTHDYALANARVDKTILAHNTLLTAIAPERFPEKHRPYSKDVIVKTVPARASAANLSDRDQVAVVGLVKQNRHKIAENHPRELLELQRNIELVTLEQLISKMKELVKAKRTEPVWHSFFADNPFILTLTFGLPVIAIGDQVSVGGRALSGKGNKIADFLYQNNLTDNLALVEIKTPQTPLLGSAYRSDVHPPSKELSGAITQLLDQRHHLQTEIATLRYNSGQSDLQSYAIRGVVVVGTMPTERVEKKSLELFRNNLNDVVIMTFDELLEKLMALHALLKPANENAEDKQSRDTAKV